MARRGAGIYSMLCFGGTVTLNSLVVYIAYNLDKLLLGRFWGADVLGIYGRAYQLINVPTANLNDAFAGVGFSALSRLQNDRVRLKRYFLKGYSVFISMTAPITIFCALFADDVVMVVLGPKWADAAAIFRCLAPTILVFGIINPLGWLMQSSGMQGRSLRIALVIALLVTAGYLLGLPYGAIGVAFAFSATMTLWLVPHILWCLHGTTIRPLELLLATSRPVLSAIVAAAFAFAIEVFVGQLQTPVYRLLLDGSVMVIGYLCVLLFVMRQKRFYLELLKGLKTIPSAT
jgi:PST family polysaccharide transporter